MPTEPGKASEEVERASVRTCNGGGEGENEKKYCRVKCHFSPAQKAALDRDSHKTNGSRGERREREKL